MTTPATEPHPKGKRRVGTCEFIECPNDATEQRRIVQVSRPHAARVMVMICPAHAKALDEGMTLLVEYRSA